MWERAAAASDGKGLIWRGELGGRISCKSESWTEPRILGRGMAGAGSQWGPGFHVDGPCKEHCFSVAVRASWATSPFVSTLVLVGNGM